MWNLQYTVKIINVDTSSFSNVCRYIFKSADGKAGPQWPRFQNLDALHVPLAGVPHNARVRGGNACERLLIAYVVGAWGRCTNLRQFGQYF